MTLSINRLNPNCTTFTVGNRTWYFSYQTCVGFEQLGTEKQYPVDHKGTVIAHALRIRRDQHYSPTTAKHMSYMGVSSWPRVDDATFEEMAGGQ